MLPVLCAQHQRIRQLRLLQHLLDRGKAHLRRNAVCFSGGFEPLGSGLGQRDHLGAILHLQQRLSVAALPSGSQSRDCDSNLSHCSPFPFLA